MSNSRDEVEAAEGAALASIVSALVDVRAQIATLQAQEARQLAAAQAIAVARSERLVSRASVDSEMTFRSIAAEVGAALHESDRAVQRLMDDAATVVTRFPQTVRSWESGAIGAAHVRGIADAGAPLDGDARAAYESAVLLVAEAESPARTRAYARRTAEALHPVSITERHRAARRSRDVFVVAQEDGMSDLVVSLPTVLAEGCRDRLTQQAKKLLQAIPDDPRRLGEVRADLAVDMLLTAAPTADELAASAALDGAAPGGLGAIRAVVHVTVPALTLAGRSDRGAVLDGQSPIDAETARLLAGDATGWDRVLTHPVTGSVIEVDRYTPTSDLKRFLRARDQRCRFPGCRQPAHRSDIDHTRDRALGGATARSNLAHLCTRHHTLKHATPWRVRQLGDGLLEWTSPTGRVYVDAPPTPSFATAPTDTVTDVNTDIAPF